MRFARNASPRTAPLITFLFVRQMPIYLTVRTYAEPPANGRGCLLFHPVLAPDGAEQADLGLIADALDITWAAVPGKTAIWLFPTYYVRELYGILYEWIF